MMIQNMYGLSDEQIKEQCPSVFAETPHESRSMRYGYIPTSDVLESLREAGFAPTTVMQSLSRIEGREAHTKHLLRLRRLDDLGYSKPDVHEAVVVNSHDGSSAYAIMGGVFRMVCTNGMIVGDIDSTLKVRHTGDVASRVVESTLTIVEESEQVMEQVAAMKQVDLSQGERLLLAEFALKARYGEAGNTEEEGKGDEKKLVVFQPVDLLTPRRRVDRATDLYTTFNTIQENVTRGGLTRRDTQGKRHTVRAIRGIDQNVKINQLLWQFSARLLELKTN